MLTPDDVVQIHQVLAEYGHVVDDHAWDRADQVFTADFVFELGDPERPDLHGIADLVSTFKGRNTYAHHTTNISITEDDEAHRRRTGRVPSIPTASSAAAPGSCLPSWSTSPSASADNHAATAHQPAESPNTDDSTELRSRNDQRR